MSPNSPYETYLLVEIYFMHAYYQVWNKNEIIHWKHDSGCLSSWVIGLYGGWGKGVSNGHLMPCIMHDCCDVFNKKYEIIDWKHDRDWLTLKVNQVPKLVKSQISRTTKSIWPVRKSWKELAPVCCLLWWPGFSKLHETMVNSLWHILFSLKFF